MHEHDPKELRQVYFDAWQKELKGQPLTPLEAIIVDIIKRHPEYHALFSHPEAFNDNAKETWALDHNPFFHLALHVTIAEQISANRPVGIQKVYQRLLKKNHDQTQVEHKMIECLARILVSSFNSNTPANEDLYLESLKRL